MNNHKFDDDPAEPEIAWSHLNTKQLRDRWMQSEVVVSASAEDQALITRYASICEITESDRIWPLAAACKPEFKAALSEVLSRLPQEDFYRVDSDVEFVLEEPELKALAMNVPTRKEIQIIFFHSSWLLRPEALVGLVAHEIAHTFIEDAGLEHAEVERLTNEKARAWGFSKELEQLEREKARLAVEPRS